MCKPTAVLFLLLSTAAGTTAAAEVTIIVDDPDGSAARVGAPVSVEVDLAQSLGEEVMTGHLKLRQSTPAPGSGGRIVPIQFEPETADSLRGRLWWIMPPGPAGERRFKLVFASVNPPRVWRTSLDKDRQGVDLLQEKVRVLRYSHGTVPVPEGIDPHYARGDYISLLFGPDGELLSDDYPRDHPHHRGVSWSWPVTRWKGEVRDIWAVRGVWARPVSIWCRAAAVMATIRAESVWKWGDKDPIVRENVLIRAFEAANRCRIVDVEVRLTALAEGVAIGGRPKAGYGGFGLRAAPSEQRKITAHTDPVEAKPRRSWLDYSGVFSGGRGAAGVAIFEHVSNPGYPSQLHQYPQCNYVMPAFPGPREVPLKQDRPLVLKHRLWIHPGQPDAKTLADVWASYASPPKVTVAK